MSQYSIVAIDGQCRVVDWLIPYLIDDLREAYELADEYERKHPAEFAYVVFGLPQSGEQARFALLPETPEWGNAHE